jgi:hypothetical protein
MRELTEQEKANRDRLRGKMEQFLAERMPLLADFAERLELKDSVMIVIDPEKFLEPVDEFMRYQVVEPEDRGWTLTRLGYFIGELLVHRLGGCWFLNEIPDSRYFLRYVVGRCTGISNSDAMIDPFYVADVYLSEPAGRSLSNFLDQVTGELRDA